MQHMSQNSSLCRQQRRLNNQTDESSELSSNDDKKLRSSIRDHIEWDSNIISSRRSDRGYTQTTKQISELKPFYSDNESCSKRVVEKQDAEEYFLAREKMPFRNFICKMMLTEGHKKFNQSDISNAEQKPETLLSPKSLLTSSESKTYSQLYSEIYEESKERLENAEHIGKALTNKKPKWQKDQYKFLNRYNKSKGRTARWVANYGEPDIDDYSTETISDSDMELESWHESVNDDEHTQTLSQEQLEAISVYQNEPFNFRKYMKESMLKLAEDQLDIEDSYSYRSHHYNTNSFEVCSECSPKTPNFKCLKGKSRIEVLHFEHCDVYHIRITDKAYTERRQSDRNKKDSPRTFAIESSYTPVSSQHEEDCKSSKPNFSPSSESEANSYLEFREELSSHRARNRSKKPRLKIAKKSYKDSDNKIKYSARTVSNESASGSLTPESQRSNESKRYLHNSYKTLHSSARSISQSERYSNCNTYPVVEFDGFSINLNDSNDDYYLSSKSVTSAKSTNNSTRTYTATSKRFQDRASSPIQIISSAVKIGYQMIEEAENYDEQEYFEAKSELDNQLSLASIISEDKAVQYPSGDELDTTVMNTSNEPQVQTSDLDDFKGNAIKVDNEDESLDDSEGKDTCFLPTANQSSTSIWSTSSDEPSRRFYRRTEPLEDENINPFDTDDDAEPLTYQKHVSRLAARAFHYCMNYNETVSSRRPALEVEISHKMQMIYDSEMQFQSYRRLKKRDDLLQKLNQQLQEQLTNIAPNFQ